MVVPIIILVAIPLFLGIVYAPPFDLPEEPREDIILEEPTEFNDEVISDEPGVNILYFFLMGIWIIILIRILLQIKKGTFKISQRY